LITRQDNKRCVVWIYLWNIAENRNVDNILKWFSMDRIYMVNYSIVLIIICYILICHIWPCILHLPTTPFFNFFMVCIIILNTFNIIIFGTYWSYIIDQFALKIITILRIIAACFQIHADFHKHFKNLFKTVILWYEVRK
jgi:hypothetical protein